MSLLRRMFPLTEATPFSPQVGTQASYSVNRSAGVGASNTPMKKTLGQVEDLLRRVMAAENNQALNRTINQFLVDITPYLEDS
jgi:negative regulator of replication initiation